MKAQFFHYEILEVKSIEALHEFKDHPRLKVFHQKGCKCVKCGKEATQIALGEGKGKKSGKHWDLYTNDFYPLTVDHIIPKSRGGGEELENKQPMCYGCNQMKGSRIEGEDGDTSFKTGSNLYSCIGHTCAWPNKKRTSSMMKFTPKVGDEVWIKIRTTGKHCKYLGVVSNIVINPYTKRKAFMLEGNTKSMHHLEVAYKTI